MEQQNHKQSDKRIHILIGLAAVAMITGMAGLVIALMKPASPQPLPSSTGTGSVQSDAPYREVITESPDRLPQGGGTFVEKAPPRGGASIN